MDTEATACVYCGDVDCYRHCSGSENGEHEADPATAAVYQDHGSVEVRGTAADPYIVIDVTCRFCGESGSFTVGIGPNDNEVQWA